MIHSFLLIGQSNMAGRGDIAEAPAIDTAHIKVLRNGRFQNMYRPVNQDRHFSGFCLAESFAERYAKQYGVDVGLIACADGGTALHQWQPGTLLFDHAVYQARLAQRTSTIAGVLWHQGESDAVDGISATYAQRFLPVMGAFRRELNLYDVPFLLGGLGDYLADYKPETARNYPAVNLALRQIAKEQPMTGFVSAEGLRGKSDNLHFNTASLYEFGLRYFEEFEKLRDPGKIFEEKPHPDNAVRTAMELL